MKRLTQIGLASVCLALLAPAPARADSVGVMSAMYEASFVRLAADHEDAGRAHAKQGSLFTWCKRCAAPDASPFLVGANLSSASSERDGGFGVTFNGGFSASFGVAAFPVPAMSSSSSTSTSSPTITLPPSSSSGGGPLGTSGVGTAAATSGGSGSIVHAADPIASSVGSTGRAAIVKAESLAATPEPATLLLLGTGLVGIAGRRAWRRQA